MRTKWSYVFSVLVNVDDCDDMVTFRPAGTIMATERKRRRESVVVP